MTVLRFIVPLLPKAALSPNGNKGGGWQARAAATKELREATFICAVEALGARVPLLRARVGVEYRITSQRPRDGFYRPRDVANAVAALKPLYDGLTDACVIEDDSAEHMELGPHRIVKVERYEDEGLYVIVEEL